MILSEVPLPTKVSSKILSAPVEIVEKQPSQPKVDEGLMSERQKEEQRMKANAIIPFLEEIVIEEGKEVEGKEVEEKKEPEEPPPEDSKNALHLRRTNKRSGRYQPKSLTERLSQEVGGSNDTLDNDGFTKDDEAITAGHTSPEHPDVDSEEDLNITIADSDISNYQKPAVDASNIENEVMVGGSDDDFMKKLDHKPDMSMTTSMEQRIKKVSET